MSKPPRSAMTMRSMLGAIGLLAAIVLLFGGLTRACTFAPGGPTIDPAPVVDAPAELARLAKEVTYPVRVPAVPPTWRANSAGLDPVGDGSPARIVRVGYLTPAAHYLRLQQGDVAEEKILSVVTGPTVVPATGPVDVAGRRWVVYGGAGRAPIWIADLGAVRLLITGSGDDAEFRALAAAAQQAPILHS